MIHQIDIAVFLTVMFCIIGGCAWGAVWTFCIEGRGIRLGKRWRRP